MNLGGIPSFKYYDNSPVSDFIDTPVKKLQKECERETGLKEALFCTTGIFDKCFASEKSKR